jgi:biofilm PGA synthesis N-glycosyltransferase PgaC
MTGSGPRMILVCCFLNEERHLPELLESMAVQARLPDRLLLVDDGSSDRSLDLARAFAEEYTFASFLRRPKRRRNCDRLAQAAELRAFHWALTQISEPFDLIGKLDADLRLTPQTLSHLESCFIREPQLGLIGPYLSEYDTDGRRRRDKCPSHHVRGALKLYRRECFERIEPIPEVLGWDTIDEIAARMHGYATRSEAVPDGDPLHLRPTGRQDGTVRAYRRWGKCAWGFGAHPLHVLLGAARRIPARPPVVGSLNYVAGWMVAGVRRAPRAGADVRAFAREEQLARMRPRGRAARLNER